MEALRIDNPPMGYQTGILRRRESLPEGTVLELPDGRVGVTVDEYRTGDTIYAYMAGRYRSAKLPEDTFHRGSMCYWSPADLKARSFLEQGTFPVGSVYSDSIVGAETVDYWLNEIPRTEASLRAGLWGEIDNDGIMMARPGGSVLFGTTGANRLETAAIYSFRSVQVFPKGMYVDFIGLIETLGASDIVFNVGITDELNVNGWDLSTYRASCRFAAPSLEMFCQSNDIMNNVSPQPTGFIATPGQAFFVWIDARNLADVQFFVNGSRVLGDTPFSLAGAASHLLRPAAMLSKPRSQETSRVIVSELSARGAYQQ